MENSDLQQYSDFLIDFLEPIVKASENIDSARAFLIELGYEPPGDVTAFGELKNIINDIFDVIISLETLIESNSNDNERKIKVLLEMFIKGGGTVKHLTNFSTKIQGNFPGSNFLTQTDIITALPIKLTDLLFITYLEKRLPTLHSILLFIGIIEDEYIDEIPPYINLHKRRIIYWDKIPQLLTDPIKLVKEAFVENDSIKFNKLIYLLEEIGVLLGVFTEVNLPDYNKLKAFNDPGILSSPLLDDVRFLRFPLVSDPLAQLAVEIYPIINTTNKKYDAIGAGIIFGSQLEIPIGDKFILKIKLSASLLDSLGVIIEKNGKFSFNNSIFSSPQTLPDTVQLNFNAIFQSVENPLTGKLLEIGAPGGSRFGIGIGAVSFGIDKKASDATIFIESDFKDGLVVISLGGADSFIGSIMSGNEISSKFNLGIGFSNKGGLYFKGGSLEIALPVHIQLGPIELLQIAIGLKIAGKDIKPNVSTSFNAQLGPLAIVVENIGVEANIKINDERVGNFGPLDTTFGFKPPKGVGLSLDASVVKGGGYLYFNFDKEEYAGALELTIKNLFSLKAIGLITTRMPDGSPGFSLLIIITAEFGTPIQLGYGFTLSGVGGLLGLNRTMLLEPLAEGVRTGAINSVMFPTNVVENAPRIISDLKAFFPPAEGIFLIGPMAKIGWGTPNVITLSLGIIIEIPGNIAILGILKVVLKNEEAEAPAGSESEMEVLVLQVKFIGAIEFDKKRGWFFASLFESRILFMTIDGEMGLLVAWGDNPNFVISVGGFHPAFKAPPLPFPEPRRISMSILNTDYARIRVDGYFAITPNTIQFGASVDLFFGFDAFKLDGQFAFDALFRAPPLYFIITVSTSISVKVFGVGLFSVHFRGSLEGPTPWHIEGTGTVTLLFFDIPIDFSETWGEEVDTILLPIQVLQLVEKEFNKLENWKTTLPAQTRLFVSLRKIETTSDLLVLHPVGTLQISQRAVPLELQLDKVGDQKPEDVNYLSVAVNAPGLLKKADLNESFAMAQFKNMDDSKKLSSPSFEKWKAGLELAAATAQANASLAIKRVVRYEKIIIDTNYKRFIKPLFVWFSNLFSLFLNGNTVVKSTASQHFLKQKQPFTDKVVIQDEVWVVASSTDNSPLHTEAGSFSCQAKAYEYLQQQIAVNPKLADNIHVIPQTEIRRAA